MQPFNISYIYNKKVHKVAKEYAAHKETARGLAAELLSARLETFTKPYKFGKDLKTFRNK